MFRFDQVSNHYPIKPVVEVKKLAGSSIYKSGANPTHQPKEG